MEFTIKTQTLEDALNVAGLAVTNDSGVITSSVLFDVDDTGDLTLWSTDREVMTRVPTGVTNAKGSGSFSIEYSRLDQWVSNVFEDEVDVQTQDDGVVLECGSVKSHFRTLDSDAFPSLEDRFENKVELFKGDPDVFIDALKFVRPFIGDPTSNNAVANNMQVSEIREGSMLATDSVFISIFRFNEEVQNLLENMSDKFKTKSDDIKKMTSFLKKTCASEFKVYKSDSLYLIESDDGSVFGYSEAVYDLPKIPGIPMELQEDEIWEFDKNDLKSSIKVLTATANEDEKNLSIKAEGEGDNSTLTLSMKTADDKHNAVTEISCSRSEMVEEVLDMNVNHEFMVQPLSLYDNDEIYAGVNYHSDKPNETKYIKLYEELEDGHKRICFIALRKS